MSYLRHVHRVWTIILDGNSELTGFLDARTVGILQGRCPKRADADAQSIIEQQHDVLPYLSNQTEREQLWERIRSVDCIIPSIHTFLEDTKYLEPCARVMKELLPLEAKTSIYQTYKQHHNGQLRVPIQSAESRSHPIACKSRTASFRLTYVQVWLFVMRHFPVLTGHCPRKDPANPKPWTSRGDSVIRAHLFLFAKSAGFENLETRVENLEHASRQEAEKVIAHFFPSPIYSIPGDKQKLLVGHLDYLVKRYESTLRARNPETVTGEYTTDDESLSCGSDISSRCGVPFEQAFERDQLLLFLGQIYGTECSTTQKRYLSSFAIKSDTIRCFFGTLDDVAESHHLSNAPVTAKEPSVETATTTTPPEENALQVATIPPTAEPSPPVSIAQGFAAETTITSSQPDKGPQQVAAIPEVSKHPSPTSAVMPNERSNEASSDPPIRMDDPQTALVPYQDNRNFNTTRHSLEETVQIAREWYESKSTDRLVVVQETDELFVIHRLDLYDDENYERLLSSEFAIHVPDRQKKLKMVSMKGSLQEKGVFCFQPHDSAAARNELERIWSKQNGQRSAATQDSSKGVNDKKRPR